ncbi:MAG: nucleotidyltransferase domain-containing protein [Bacteroidia bacterium]|nr:nucleotidyltransferase domain-containing protein [Bacteroidia bacterium]
MDQKSAIEIGRKYLLLLLQNYYPVKQMFLYGSYARGNYHQDSDIDLAIIMTELPDPFQTQVNLLKLTWNFDTRVEPHPFDVKDFASSNPVIKEILRTGIEISV